MKSKYTIRLIKIFKKDKFFFIMLPFASFMFIWVPNPWNCGILGFYIGFILCDAINQFHGTWKRKHAELTGIIECAETIVFREKTWHN